MSISDGTCTVGLRRSAVFQWENGHDHCRTATAEKPVSVWNGTCGPATGADLWLDVGGVAAAAIRLA
jgi:hypothetical protein